MFSLFVCSILHIDYIYEFQLYSNVASDHHIKNHAKMFDIQTMWYL